MIMQPEYVSGAISPGDCLSNAWDMLKRNYGMFLGIALLALVITGCIPCFNIFLMGPVMGGVYFVVLRDMRGEPVDFGMMFKGFEKFVPLMVVGLLQSIPGIVAQIFQYTIDFSRIMIDARRGGGMDFYQASSGDLALSSGLVIVSIVVGLVFFVIGIAWWAAFFFAIPLVMEHDLGPVDAIKLSASAAVNNLGGLIVLLILQVLVAIVGLLLICFGLFFISIPVIYLSNAFAYRQVFPYFQRQMNMTPPPPNAYGFGGAQPG